MTLQLAPATADYVRIRPATWNELIGLVRSQSSQLIDVRRMLKDLRRHFVRECFARLYDRQVQDFTIEGVDYRLVKYAWYSVDPRGNGLFIQPDVGDGNRYASFDYEEDDHFKFWAYNLDEVRLMRTQHQGITLPEYPSKDGSDDAFPVVRLMTVSDRGKDSTPGNMSHVFNYQVATSEFFAVRCFKVAGSNGSATTPCTFTYKITDQHDPDIIIANSDTTPLTPEKRRPPIGRMLDVPPPGSPPDPGGIIGMARWDFAADNPDELIKLYDANEMFDPGAC